MEQKQATIIFNPMSGRPGRRQASAARMAELLDGYGIRTEVRATSAPHDATRLAREAVSSGSGIIIGYGGDGTLNEILQGMVGSSASLAVWAGGTANVVATDLGLPSNVEELAGIIAAGKTRRIAIGVAQTGPHPGGNHSDEAPGAARRYFLMFAGIGLDASVCRAVNMKLKRLTGEFAFWVAGIEHIWTWKAEHFEIEVDGRRYEAPFAVIANGRSYGGGIVFAPGADLEEPCFEVFILPPRSRNLGYLGDLVTCLFGHPEKTDAVIVKGRKVIARSTHSVWVEVDGEVAGPLPMTFDIEPEALSIIVP